MEFCCGADRRKPKMTGGRMIAEAMRMKGKGVELQ